MINNPTICVYHNGNSRVVEFYKKKFQHLIFAGNLSESENYPSGHLWEVCFADATAENLFKAKTQNVFILRHISTYKDDIEHRLPECEPFEYDDWLSCVVIGQLGFADHIVTDFHLPSTTFKNIAVITTGRTANKHFQKVLETFGKLPFENIKTTNSNHQMIIDQRYFQSESAVLMWREDQWECLTSIWIASHIGYIHQFKDRPKSEFDLVVNKISTEWIKHEWLNMCQLVFDRAFFFRYILDKPVEIMTTERAISTYQSNHEKISYNKSSIITGYSMSKNEYQKSKTTKIIDLLYSNAQKHLARWEAPV